jgi:hypothetical protein
MVKDPDRDKVAKILHNGNVGSGELCVYDKCILDIARLYDKIKNVDRVEAAKIAREGFECLKPNRKRSSDADVLSSMGQEEGSLTEMLRSSNESSKAFGDEFFAVQKEKIKLEQKQHDHRVAVDQVNLRLEQEKMLLQFMSAEECKGYVAQKLKALEQQGGP